MTVAPICRLLACGLLVACAAVPPASSGEPAPSAVRIKLATLAPKGTSFHKTLIAMGEKWAAAPGGGAALTIYTDGTMGGEGDMVRRMRVGQIQAAMLTVTGLSEIDDSVAALQNMPMMFRSLEEVDFVCEKLQPVLEKKLEEKGFIVLFWGDAGWVRFFSATPATRPDDFKKMKIFSWSGDPTATELWKTAGYQPVPLEFTDILTGLKTGLIDAVATTPSYALAGQFYGSVPHMLNLKWAPLVGATIITKQTWEQLPQPAREAMLVAARDAGREIKLRGRAENEESIEAMKKRGLTVHEVPPEIERVWRDRAEEYYPKIRGSIVPEVMFDRVVELLKEFRSRGPSGGP